MIHELSENLAAIFGIWNNFTLGNDTSSWHNYLYFIQVSQDSRLQLYATDTWPYLLKNSPHHLMGGAKYTTTSDALRRTWNDPAYGQRRQMYQDCREWCGIAHQEDLLHGRHESEPLSAPEDCALHRQYMTLLHTRLSDVRDTLFEALSSASLASWCKREYKPPFFADNPAKPARRFLRPCSVLAYEPTG
jgi:hypothetical protein